MRPSRLLLAASLALGSSSLAAEPSLGSGDLKGLDETQDDEESDDGYTVIDTSQKKPGQSNKRTLDLALKAGGGAIFVGGVGMLVRGVILRVKLKDDVMALGGLPEDGWPASIREQQDATNASVKAGYGLMFLGAGVAAVTVLPVWSSGALTPSVSLRVSTLW